MKVYEADRRFRFARRAFLRNLAAVTGAGAAAGAASGALAKVAKVGGGLSAASGSVPGDGQISAAHWGAFRSVVRKGKFVGTVPIISSPADPLIKAIPDLVYAPTRIKHPYVRKGYLANKSASDHTMRGRDQWVRVSWAQALTLVADDIARVRKQHGPEGIFGGSYGWKSVGALNNAVVLLQRMLNLGGGFIGSSGDYSTGAAQVIMPHVVGSIEVYEQQTVWPVVVQNSELIVMWGADAMNTLKISWTVPDFVGYKGLAELQKKGTPVIVIDPVRSETARQMNAEWLPVRQRTDVAMMLGVMHTLYAESLHNDAFLTKYTVGFDKFERYLNGKDDGTPKSAEWAAAICGIAPDKIRELARRMAKSRTMIMGGWSLQRQQNGEQAHWMLVTLAAMLGQIGLPGGGFGFSYHYSSGGSPTAKGGVLAGINSGKAGGGPEWLQSAGAKSIPVARIADCLLNPGKTIDFNGKQITYPDIRLVYWSGGNPFAHHQDTGNLVKAFQKPDTVIVNEFSWTPTARMADIVLPATTPYERNDLDMGGDYSSRYIFPMHKIVDPQGEARNDFDIFADISERLGYREKFTEGKDEAQWLKTIYDSAVAGAQRANVPIAAFDDFWKSGEYIEFPVPAEAQQWVRFAKFREDPLLEALGTPSGKIEIYSESVAKMNYADCGPHPRWFEPDEWWRAPAAKEYPLGLISAHPPLRLHSQLSNTSLRKQYEVAGREPIWIHPEDAASRGIRSGDVLRVRSPHGAILAGAVVTENIRPGYVLVNEGAWYDPEQPGNPRSLCKHGNVNTLVKDIPTSKLANGNCGQSGIVQVEKYKGTPPPVTVFLPPRGAA